MQNTQEKPMQNPQIGSSCGEEEINIRRLKEERKQQRQKQSFQIMRKEAERSLGLGKWELNTTRTGDAS